jgi:hypothetical protein
MFGLTSLDDRYLYVTDGGHYDNLGLIELLRRGCTTIFCLDAGGDRGGTYVALGEAVALARSELQVDIEIDPTPIIPDEKTRTSKHDFVTGRYRFCATPSRPAPGSVVDDQSTRWMGELVYCRAAVTADAPWDVRAFHERDKHFPYHSTFDQLFNDEKFESYRALGAHTARRAICGWRRKLAVEKTEEVLREVARANTTIRYADLLARVRDELTRAELPTLRMLLDEIGEAEEAARRPPLVLVVQESRPCDAETEKLLSSVHEYWAAAQVVAGEKRAALSTAARPEPEGNGRTPRRRHMFSFRR